MRKVLIVWAPDTAENRRIVDDVRGSFDGARFTASTRAAAETTIADIADADLVVFGLQKQGASDIPPEFAELVRIFKGVTLAGRTAGFFSMGAERASARLRKALKDTEISLLEEDPVFSEPKSERSHEIAEWVRKLTGAQ
jgi:flavodoxin